MALITWNKDWSVEVEEIDRQHKELVDYMNDLNDAMLSGKGKEVMSKVINSLASYTVEHFSCEEKYFARFGYPETVAHKEEHDLFIQQVTGFKKEFEEGTLTITSSVMGFLRDWLFKHIKRTDRKYISCFQANGVF